MDKVLIIDGHNAMWRAKFAFKPSDKDSEYVMIYSFFRNLRPIIEKFSPSKVFFVLEGHPQFRYDIYSEYKANRIKTASKQEQNADFHKNKHVIVDLLKLLPITICKTAHYECDDLIHTLCLDLKDEEIVVLSNDSDYIQLLQNNYKSISVYNPVKKVFMQAPEYPYVVWKSLAGDTSDNIPGMVSDKKADMLCRSPNQLREYLSHEETRANFYINLELIKFRTVPSEEIEFFDSNVNYSKLREEFIRMGFNTIADDKYWLKYISTFDCIKF